MGEVSKSFTLIQGNDEKQRIPCKECGRETSHAIVSSFVEKNHEDFEYGHCVSWDCDNQIIQCLGCETVSFRTVQTCSEEVEYRYDDKSHYIETIKYYPVRTKTSKSFDSNSLPYSIKQIYEETILSIENEQFVLAGIGVRAIIETICKEQEAEGKYLNKKIDSLANKSIITPDDADTLHKLRILGNEAAHEVKVHDTRQLELAIQIIEHMLHRAYTIPAKVQRFFPK